MDLRNALTVRGFVAICQGRYTEALEPYTECVGVCRGLGSSWQLATSHLNLGVALLHCGRTDVAVERFTTLCASALNHIAHAALADNDLARADRLASEALASVTEQEARQGIAEALEALAAVAGPCAQR